MAFCSHVEIGLWFITSIDDFLDVFDFITLKIWKYFFNLQNFSHIVVRKQSLSV